MYVVILSHSVLITFLIINNRYGNETWHPLCQLAATPVQENNTDSSLFGHSIPAKLFSGNSLFVLHWRHFHPLSSIINNSFSFFYL